MTQKTTKRCTKNVRGHVNLRVVLLCHLLVFLLMLLVLCSVVCVLLLPWCVRPYRPWAGAACSAKRLAGATGSAPFSSAAVVLTDPLIAALYRAPKRRQPAARSGESRKVG